MSRALTDTSDFYCTCCGNKGIPIARISGKERKAGHLKKIFCITCKKETNHVECKPWSSYSYENFLSEFDYKNFDENGNRIEPYGQFKGRIING